MEVITQGKAVPSTVADGLLSVRMAEAIYASIRKDQSISLE
jgi:predicted dehydrogenase